MKKIIIVCAGVYGREVLTVIQSINQIKVNHGEEPEYEILGFIDDNQHALDDVNIDIPILGGISDWNPISDEKYAIGAAFPETKEKLVKKLKEKGCQFETLIAPWSVVSRDCHMGEGCFITAYSIGSGVTLGNFVNINGSMICPGAIIGDYSTTTGFSVIENAIVGESVFIGSHAVIKEGIHIGEGAMISAGSIVQEDVMPGVTVFGVPAKEMF